MKSIEGYVYDSNIKDNHSYVTEMGIVVLIVEKEMVILQFI